MKKTILAALILGAVFTAAASDQPAKPPVSQTTGGGQQIQLKTPFRVSADGQYIYIVNAGDADWVGPLWVSATCAPVAPTTTCGSSFPGGTFKAYFATFPAGHGPGIVPKGPTAGLGGLTSQETEGAGWMAVFMGLPTGSYRVVAKAANNYSPETSIKIAAPASGPIHASPGALQVNPGTIQVNPGTLPITPTKTPVRRP